MKLKDKVIIVTGAASGIGRALCEVFACQAPKALICADVNIDGAKEISINNNGIEFLCDVSDEQNIQQMIDHVEVAYGPIDLFCSNAGILTLGGAEVSNEDWQRIWEINVMAHVWAARHLVPKMLARGGGYFLNTASAAGLLTQIGSAPYSVTKHAAVSFAEWLVITYGTRGIKASVLCPQAVETAMTAVFDVSSAHVDGMKTAEEVALACLNAIENEEFMVLPHEEVLEYSKRRVMDKERWLKGMQKLNDLYGFEPS